jgi:hypothetical protein
MKEGRDYVHLLLNETAWGLSIDYCILTMEIMEIYHKCNIVHQATFLNMGMTKAFGFFPTIYQEYKQKTSTM